MKIGKYKNQEVKVYDSGNEFIVEFSNGATITMSDVSEINFGDEDESQFYFYTVLGNRFNVALTYLYKIALRINKY